MTQHVKYTSLADAYRAADLGLLHVYVAPSLGEGWLGTIERPPLKWYEKIVLVDRKESRGFLDEAEANEPFALIAIFAGFIAFVARGGDEYFEERETVEFFVEAVVQKNVDRGLIHPSTYEVPG